MSIPTAHSVAIKSFCLVYLAGQCVQAPLLKPALVYMLSADFGSFNKFGTSLFFSSRSVLATLGVSIFRLSFFSNTL